MVQVKEAPAARVAAVAHAREVDEKVAALWDAYWTALAPADQKRKEAKQHEADNRRRTRNYNPRYEREREPYVGSEDNLYYLQKAERLNLEADLLVAAAQPLAQAAQAFDDANYTGWQRFFLVEHIHRSTHCSSFRANTRVGWLPKVSGLTEAEAVGEYGSVLCTICFPSAPVEWTLGQLKEAGVCEGSGTSVYDAPETRTGYYSGNWAACPNCGKHVGISSSGARIPKHKPESK